MHKIVFNDTQVIDDVNCPYCNAQHSGNIICQVQTDSKLFAHQIPGLAKVQRIAMLDSVLATYSTQNNKKSKPDSKIVTHNIPMPDSKAMDAIQRSAYRYNVALDRMYTKRGENYKLGSLLIEFIFSCSECERMHVAYRTAYEIVYNEQQERHEMLDMYGNKAQATNFTSMVRHAVNARSTLNFRGESVKAFNDQEFREYTAATFFSDFVIQNHLNTPLNDTLLTAATFINTEKKGVSPSDRAEHISALKNMAMHNYPGPYGTYILAAEEVMTDSNGIYRYTADNNEVNSGPDAVFSYTEGIDKYISFAEDKSRIYDKYLKMCRIFGYLKHMHIYDLTANNQASEFYEKANEIPNVPDGFDNMSNMYDVGIIIKYFKL